MDLSLTRAQCQFLCGLVSRRAGVRERHFCTFQIGSSGPVFRAGVKPVAIPNFTDVPSGPAAKDCHLPFPKDDQQKAASCLSLAPGNASP
jgi:hypothetical protein